MNEYTIKDLLTILNNLKEKKLENIKQEILIKYEKSILDLTKEEVDKASINVKKEYNILLKYLTLELSKYTTPTLIQVETLRDLNDKIAYYKKK